jgi:hypothetical protein
MALVQLGFQVQQQQLATLLGVRPGLGTRFSNIQALARYGIDLHIISWQGADSLKTALEAPSCVVITAILTTPGLLGWGELATQHAVVLTEITPPFAAYHDPALPTGPVQASLEEFLLAWSEMDEMAAILRRT